MVSTVSGGIAPMPIYNENGVMNHKPVPGTTWESSIPLEEWKMIVENIPERCDLSGLSKESVKYQLASTGIDGESLAADRRSIALSSELLDSVKAIYGNDEQSLEAIVLFAVHQMLKGYGNGTHTTIASVALRSHKLSSSWAVSPTTVSHENRESQTVSKAVEATLASLQSITPQNTLLHPNEIVMSELVDLIVVFGSPSQSIPLPDFPLILFADFNKHFSQFTFQYTHSLFNTNVIDSFLGALNTLLAAALNQSQLVTDVELLPSEQIALMDKWNNTDGTYPVEKRLHHLFEESAEKCKHQIAIICGDRFITYNQLNILANKLARHLVSVGIQPEQLVGLFLDKSEKMIATILGVWKSGAAHVPIDPAYPDERVRFVLEDTKVKVMIASEKHYHRLTREIAPGRDIWVIPLEPLLDALEIMQTPESSQNLTHLLLTSKQLAYVTYTSGTTGFPKGIYKEHTSVVNSITDLANRYGVAGNHDETIMLFSAYVFEPFVRQMLMALTTGNRLAIISDEAKFDPNVLLPFIQTHQVTYLNGTASVLQEYDFTSCPSLKRIILVGENLTDARYAALRRRFKNKLFNEYGFTESAFVTALNIFEPDSERNNTSLGRPVRNVKCYILDADLKRVPPGVTGELHIGGLGISRGYMNRPDLTKQKFLLNPFQTPQERTRGVNGLMYKTGDLARWLPNGEVEYLGRVDFQIKLRGIRIEPGEIESNLAMYPGVRTSIVVSKKLLSSGVETTQDHLVGYFVCDERTLSESDMLSFLESRLPRYMIPTRLVQLPAIPVNINGKADLRALPVVEVAVPSTADADRRDSLDDSLAQIWSDILTVPLRSIGLETNFFRLGGHSITCIQLIARVRQCMGRGISLEEVFQTRTLKIMSDLLRTKPQDSLVEAGAEKTERDSYLANSLQQGFVYHSLKVQHSDAYIMQSLLHYETSMDASLYQTAWRNVQKRNPALRLRFSWETDVIQVVDSETSLHWSLLSTEDLTAEAPIENHLERILSEDRQFPYQLELGGLIRVYFLKLSESQTYCIFSCHHSILDGWSLPLLFDSVHEEYLLQVAGHVSPLTMDSAYLDSQVYLESHRDDHLEFWSTQVDQIEERCDMNSLLNEASRYKVPLADYDRIQEQKSQSIKLPWDKSRSELKEELSTMGVTLHSMLQLVWHLVLHSYGGGSHTVTGTTISGRNLPITGIESALGLFINTLPLVVDHAAYRGKTALEAIELVQAKVTAMNSRSNVDLGRLQKGDLKHGLFDTLFVLENYPNLDTSQRELHQQQLKYTIKGGTEKLSYPLAVIAQELDDGCSFTLCYASELFADETIEVLLHTVHDTFNNIISNIHAPISHIEYLSDGQLKQLDKWNDTVADFPNQTLDAIFELEAARKSEKVAVVYEDVSLNYRQLNERSNALAEHLKSLVDIQPNKLIALVMEKSEHMITSILAVWKSGGAYVPIDPRYPNDRIEYILQDTKALALITDGQYMDRFKDLTQGAIPLIQSDLPTTLSPISRNASRSSTPTDLAYVMYTSGTTGRPKGVMVEHHGVVNLAISLGKIFGLRETDDEVILSFSNYVFDHFVEQMTDALLNGQTLVVLNDDMRGDKERLYRYIETNKVTYLSGTPSVISMYEFTRFRDHMRRIDCVGEAFSEPVFDKIRDTFPGLVINGYGPTEVSITTHKRLYPYPERRTDKSIGCQIDNSTSYVLNDEMKRVPIGAVGELYLGGDGVARGYHNREDLTAERFPLNPYQTELEKKEGRNGRLYKTGDLVRWIANADGTGEIEYLGRNDFQVKIRGQRIELGEIEAILSSFPGITQSVVLAKDRQSDGQKYLAGYYVSSGSLAPQAIRRYMQTRLPVSLVPAYLVSVAKFPVTVSGKLDTKALPVPDETAEDDVVAPRTEVERVLAGIFADLLEIPIDSVSIHSDFFSLGGDSLKSTKLSFAASKALGVAVSVTSLFKHPTVEALAHWIVSGSSDLQVISPLEESELVNIPVSPAQQRLLFIDQFDGGNAYNIDMHYQLGSDISIEAMEKAIREMVVRHESLRTIFRRGPTSYHVQNIISPEAALQQFSLVRSNVENQESLDTEMASNSRTQFNLHTDIPFRAWLYQLDDVTFASFIFHHAAFDAWSCDILRRDLLAYYNCYKSNGVSPNLPILRVQYKEYAVEHRKTLHSDRFDVLVNFWKTKVAGLESLHIPTDRPRPAQFNYSGHDISSVIERSTSLKLKGLAKDQGTSVYTVMLAAYCYLLNVYTSQTDVSLGLPVAHRNHPEFESVVGFFVNLLPLKLSVSQNTFKELVSSVQKEVLEAQIHQDMPFQEITKLLHIQHDPSRHPLVQTVFNWESMPSKTGDSCLAEYSPSSITPIAKFDLNVTVKENEESLIVNFNYPTNLFDSQTIQGFVDTYIHVIDQITENGDIDLAAIGFSDRETESPNSPVSETSSNGSAITESLAELFEHHAAVSPRSTALADSSGSLTYSELNAKSNQLAWWMMTYKKIQPDDLIALALDKSIHTIICILAVWKLGAAYVPLDPIYPEERLSFILGDTSAKILLTTSNYVDKLPSSLVRPMAIDAPEIQKSLSEQSTENLATSQSPSNLAYVIYTSGTTGKPKGVLVEQRSVAKFRDAIVDRYFGNTNGSHAVLFLSNYVFDFSVEQFNLSFLSGNKLVIPPAEGLTSEEFYSLANNQQLTYISGTPSVLQQIALSRLQHLQIVTAAGEEFHGSQYEALRAQFRGPINNAYGITETTVYNLVTSFAPSAPFSKALCDELPGSHVFVLNDRLQRVPLNAVGELHLAGDCVSRGYLNRDKLTKERFIPNPFVDNFKSSNLDRLYKTGDLVRYLGPGKLEYLGRRDQQVKLRGFRIELAEVRDALAALPHIKESAIIPNYDKKDDFSRTAAGLTGYYVLEEGWTCSAADIRDSLASTLPQFMIPSSLHQIEGSLPVTINGKLDTARLSATSFTQQGSTYATPRTTLEARLCQLWATVLDVAHCGIDDDLFTSGGDSISSLKLVGDINRDLGLKITVKDIFLNRTVRGLHDNVISNGTQNSLLPPLKAEQGQVQGDASLLPIQEWFFSKTLENPHYWNHCFSIKVPKVDTQRLGDALTELHERHDMLRMRLRQCGTSFVQSFSDCKQLQLHNINIEEIGPAGLEKTLDELQSTFNLEGGPLYAVAHLSGYEDGSERIWFALHHLIVDTVSWSILISDLQTLYNDGSLGMKTSSYQQWTGAVESYAMNSEERSYWENLRDRITQTALRDVDKQSHVQIEAKIGQNTTAKLLHNCSSTLAASMHDIVLMAVGSAWQQVTGASSIVTVEGHGREVSVDPSLDVSRTLGWFTSMYPFEIPKIESLTQGVLDVKDAVHRVPNNGIGYGAAYGYIDGSLPEISVNYLGRVDQIQSNKGKWQLAIGEEEYRHGLHTSEQDRNKSSSNLDITVSVMNGELVIQIGSYLEAETTQQLLNGIQSSLVNLVEEVSRPDFHIPQKEITVDFIPYVTFDEGLRTGTPLFMLPPGEGGAESYFRNIVQQLSSRNLVVFNNHYRDLKTLKTIEELADFYISHIQEVQPKGPYDLLGWSFGGILALEIAKRLARDGHSIGTLALIDPYFDIPSATKAIGQGKNEVLDPIYYVYHPAVDSFKILEKSTDKIALFKATETNDQHGNAAQRELYQWYAECETNSLDKYLSRDAFQVTALGGTHFTWVHDEGEVQKICRLLE